MTWTWDPSAKSADITLSGGNLVATGTSSSDSNVIGTVGATTGKYYWEVVATNVDSITIFYGLGLATASVNLDGWIGSGAADGVATYRQTTSWDMAGTNFIPVAPGFGTGDRLGIAWDASSELLWITKNGTTWYGSTSTGDPASGTGGLDCSPLNAGPYFPVLGLGNLDVATLVPDAASWGYTPPTGFGELGAPPAVILIPDADISDGSWTDQAGGTTLYAAIDETSYDDADYIKSGPSPSNDVCEIRLSNPGGTPTESMVVRYRYKRTGSIGSMELRVRLLQGGTQIATWTHSAITSTFVDGEQFVSSGEFAAISDFDDLRLEFRANLT